MMSTAMCCGTNQSMTPTPTLSRDLRASLATSVQQQEPPHSDEEQLVPIGRSPMPDDVSSAVATAGSPATLVGKRGAEVETVSMLTLVGTPGCDSPPDSPRVDSGQDDAGDDDDDDDDDGQSEKVEDKNAQRQPPDTRMVPGTRIWVAGYGEGRVEGFKAMWIGANEHTVCFDAAGDDSDDNDDSQATSTEAVAKRPKQMKLKLRKMEWRVISVPAAAEDEEKQEEMVGAPARTSTASQSVAEVVNMTCTPPANDEAVDVEDGEADVACADGDDGAPRAAAAEADEAANDDADEAAATGTVVANSNGGMDGADIAQGARIWVEGLGEGTVVSSRSTWLGATEHVIRFPIADDNADNGADSARTVTKKLKLRKMKWRVLEVPAASEATTTNAEEHPTTPPPPPPLVPALELNLEPAEEEELELVPARSSHTSSADAETPTEINAAAAGDQGAAAPVPAQAAEPAAERQEAAEAKVAAKEAKLAAAAAAKAERRARREAKQQAAAAAKAAKQEKAAKLKAEKDAGARAKLEARRLEKAKATGERQQPAATAATAVIQNELADDGGGPAVEEKEEQEEEQVDGAAEAIAEEQGMPIDDASMQCPASGDDAEEINSEAAEAAAAAVAVADSSKTEEGEGAAEKKRFEAAVAKLQREQPKLSTRKMVAEMKRLQKMWSAAQEKAAPQLQLGDINSKRVKAARSALAAAAAARSK